MNNIVQKNKIYGFKTFDEMPNKSVSDVTVKSNQIIYTSINNNLLKLVDNDLYIERLLSNQAYYIIGPKKYSYEGMLDGIDGYKMWNLNVNSGELLSILHKVQLDMSNSIKKTNITGVDVRFIINTGNENIIGTNNGLYRELNDGTWTNVYSGILSSYDIMSYATNEYLSTYIFSTTNGIYLIDQFEQGKIPEIRELNYGIPKESSIYKDGNIFFVGNTLYVTELKKNEGLYFLSSVTLSNDTAPLVECSSNDTEFKQYKPVAIIRIDGIDYVFNSHCIFANSNRNTSNFGKIYEDNSILMKFVYMFEQSGILIETDNEIYKYDTQSNLLILKYTGDSLGRIIRGDDGYVFVDRDRIYSINEKFRLKSLNYILSVDKIVDFTRDSAYDYLIGCEDSVLKTEQTYVIKNDIPLCSLTDVRTESENDFTSYLTNHILKDHGNGSVIDDVNNHKMPRDCSILNGIRQNTEIDDLVHKVEFSTDVRHISAFVSFHDENMISNDCLLSDISYIYKTYLKGNPGELFIYLPTTNTYYMNHSNEIKNDTREISSIYRSNLGCITSRNTNEIKTDISVLVDSDYFLISDVLFTEINGNSLPKKIYSDVYNKELFNNIGFSLVIHPSICRNHVEFVNDSNSGMNYILMRFSCIGTDAQSIRLLITNM